MKKQKYYTVWKGRCPGVFDTWKDCKLQVSGFAGAEFKSFDSKGTAELAFKGNSKDYIGKVDRNTDTMTLALQDINESEVVSCSNDDDAPF